MRILWVATKPPVPSTDGGRLAARTTIAALATAGHEVTVVAPVAPVALAAAAEAAARAGLRAELVATSPFAWPVAALRALRDGTPITIARHASAAVDARVAALVEATRFDVVHAEQLHALAACEPARRRGLPVVLRAQNVESDLWLTAGGVRALEGRRLARFEGAAVRSAAAAIALTARDAARLETLAGGGARVQPIAVPLDATGWTSGSPLPGAPAVVLPGSPGWTPNDDAVAWFVQSVWPRVRARLPGAHLHRFGAASGAAAGDAVTLHRTPTDSAALFPTGALVVVPLRRAIGVRMRILEAWARGVPVVATSAAAAGLDPGAADALVVADGPDALADALAALAHDADARARLVAAGRAFLCMHHDPPTVAAALGRVYADVAKSTRART